MNRASSMSDSRNGHPLTRNHLRCVVIAALFSLLVSIGTVQASAADGWQAGAAKVDITPQEGMWMSGYASRDHAAESTLHPLWAKALVLQDAGGNRGVIVTLDLVGIDGQLSATVCEMLAEQHGFTRDQVALCTSHTHTGPVVGGNLAAMYFLNDTQQSMVDAYAAKLPLQISDAVGKALKSLAPAQLTAGIGQATFAVNRRNNNANNVPRLREEGKLVGPYDHDVPVLAVRDSAGNLQAVLFGYACHATTLSSYQWSGDYPGFAQIALEAAHPDTVALFWAGCGADQNPLPRRTVELAESYGKRLAAAVDKVLAGDMAPVPAELETSYALIDLPLDTLPTDAELQRQAGSDNRYEASRAKILLEQIAGGTPLSQTYPYPVQVWQFGNELLWITLGGEVVVDYALRLKTELGEGKTWIAGYSNDVMAYIPSRRVLTEGGYEGGGAMVYYGLPTVWAPQVEKLIIDEVHRQARALSGE